MAIFLSPDGIEVSYQVHGDGRPIILLHGFTSSFQANWVGTGWRDFLTRHDFQVIGLDFRGHGLGEKPHHAAAYSTALTSADVLRLRLMEHLNISKTDILGFSMGAGVALYCGMHRPERWGKIAVGGFGDPAIQGHHDRQQLGEINAALESDDPHSITSPLGRKFRAFAEKANNDLKALAAMTRDLNWPGCLEEIKPIHNPVLVVEAEHDQFMAGTQLLRAALPRAQLVTIQVVNHNAVVSDQRFKKAVVEFLGGSAAGGSAISSSG